MIFLYNFFFQIYFHIFSILYALNNIFICIVMLVKRGYKAFQLFYHFAAASASAALLDVRAIFAAPLV